MESKIPKIVYKYRDWSNSFHKNILLHNELYLASPKDFNDPFDCRIPKDITNLQENGKTGNNSSQLDYEKAQSDMFDNNYGILSLSTRWNGILLWSHYANHHAGFCIGFDVEKLMRLDLFSRCGLVDYNSDFPNIASVYNESNENRIKRIHIQTVTKSDEWNSESEFRFIKPFQKSPHPFERCFNVNDEIISEVILGINISLENKEEILEICIRKNIPVYQAKKVPFKFEIDRDLIEKKCHY